MRSLAATYEPYEFGDTDGPGCGVAAHDPWCLCDVDLERHPTDPHNVPADQWAYASPALAALFDRDVPPTLQNFAAELLGLFAEAKRVSGELRLSATALDALRDRYLEKLGKPLGKYGCRDEVQSLVGSGLSLQAVANFVGRPLQEIIRFFTWDESKPSAVWCEAAELLSAGERQAAIAASTGLSEDQVHRLAKVLGVAGPKRVRDDSGKRVGGDKYTAAQYEQVLSLRADKLTYQAIAEQTGVPYNAVVGICRRRGNAAA